MSHSEFRLSNKCPWPKQIPTIKICKKKGNGLSASKTTATTATAKLKLESRKQRRFWVLWACIFQIQIAQQYLFQNGKNKNVSFRFEFFSSEKPSENLLAPPPSSLLPLSDAFAFHSRKQTTTKRATKRKTKDWKVGSKINIHLAKSWTLWGMMLLLSSLLLLLLLLFLGQSGSTVLT